MFYELKKEKEKEESKVSDVLQQSELIDEVKQVLKLFGLIQSKIQEGYELLNQGTVEEIKQSLSDLQTPND